MPGSRRCSTPSSRGRARAAEPDPARYPGRTMRLRRTLPLSLILLTAMLTGCSGTRAGDRPTLLIVVNAPFSKAPYLGTTIAQGAELAASQINARGGIDTGATAYDLRIQRLDSALSP